MYVLPPLGPHHATTTSGQLGGRHDKATIMPASFGLIDGLSFAWVDSLIWTKYSYTNCLPYSSENSIVEYVSHVLSDKLNYKLDNRLDDKQDDKTGRQKTSAKIDNKKVEVLFRGGFLSGDV